MGKLPAFQFYPADWRKDPGIQALNYEQRGVWFEILCIMHESNSRGFLKINDKKIELFVLSRMLGLTTKKTTKIVDVLVRFNICSFNKDGVMYCRRMVKDEHIRQVRKDAGQKGGEANAANLPKQTDKQKTPPSSPSPSSSPASTNNTPKPPKGGERQLTRKDKKILRVESNDLVMIEIGSWMKRRADELWTIEEHELLIGISPIQPEEMESMRRFYTAIISRRDDRRCTSVIKLLQNWTRELDKSRQHSVCSISKPDPLAEPEGWIEAFTKELGRDDFTKEWHKLSENTKREIIDHMKTINLK